MEPSCSGARGAARRTALSIGGFAGRVFDVFSALILAEWRV